MAAPSISSVVRTILTADPNLPADTVIQKARARGITAPAQSIRHVVHNVRSDVKKKALAAPAAARQTAKPAGTAQKPVATQPAFAPLAPTSPPGDLAVVLANVALVNSMVGLCGGVDNARQVAEAVRSCGGVDPFLQHLDLVAGIRTSPTGD